MVESSTINGAYFKVAQNSFQCIDSDGSLYPLFVTLGAYNSKTARWNFIISSNFDNNDKTQLLAKFDKFQYIGFRATLNFQNFKVALHFMTRFFSKFAKSCVLSYLSKVNNIKKFHRAVLEL